MMSRRESLTPFEPYGHCIRYAIMHYPGSLQHFDETRQSTRMLLRCRSIALPRITLSDAQNLQSPYPGTGTLGSLAPAQCSGTSVEHLDCVSIKTTHAQCGSALFGNCPTSVPCCIAQSLSGGSPHSPFVSACEFLRDKSTRTTASVHARLMLHSCARYLAIQISDHY